jgi:hypothetical protein
MKKSLLLTVLVATYLFAVGYAYAVPYTFTNITNNSSIDAATGETQLLMDVTEVGSQVQFMFTNTGPNASSITDIYFQDPTPILLFQSLTQSSGVDFSQGANPPILPGGNVISFTTTHSYDSDPPAQPNGVNPGEWLALLFNVADTYSFNDVIAQLNDETLRVGLHVQGFEGGGSESFVDNPNNNPVPEPGTVILLGIGLFGIAVYNKRRNISD